LFPNKAKKELESHITPTYVEEIMNEFVKRLYIRIGWACFLGGLFKGGKEECVNPSFVLAVDSYYTINMYSNVPIYCLKGKHLTPDGKYLCVTEVMCIEPKPFYFLFSVGTQFFDEEANVLASSYAPIENITTTKMENDFLINNVITENLIEMMDDVIDGIKNQKNWMRISNEYRKNSPILMDTGESRNIEDEYI